MCCQRYSDVRRNYLGNLTWPTMNKFNYFMQSNNKSSLLKTVKFIKEAMVIRKNKYPPKLMKSERNSEETAFYYCLV